MGGRSHTRTRTLLSVQCPYTPKTALKIKSTQLKQRQKTEGSHIFLPALDEDHHPQPQSLENLCSSRVLCFGGAERRWGPALSTRPPHLPGTHLPLIRPCSSLTGPSGRRHPQLAPQEELGSEDAGVIWSGTPPARDTGHPKDAGPMTTRPSEACLPLGKVLSRHGGGWKVNNRMPVSFLSPTRMVLMRSVSGPPWLLIRLHGECMSQTWAGLLCARSPAGLITVQYLSPHDSLGQQALMTPIFAKSRTFQICPAAARQC